MQCNTKGSQSVLTIHFRFALVSFYFPSVRFDGDICRI